MKTPWSDREWRRVLVYGLGVSGASAVRFLRRRGVAVLAVDDRRLGEEEAKAWAGDGGVELRVAAELDELPGDVDGVVVSPGVRSERPLLAAARRRGLRVIGEIELAFAFLDGDVVGITGSNGKSTTTALTGSLLRGAGRKAVVCGNFGRPLADCVDAGTVDAGTVDAGTVDAGTVDEGTVDAGRVIFVTELSSFQLESTDTFRPRAAALLNLSPDHLDRHGDLETYAAAKARIFANQRAGDVAVFNADDPRVLEVGRRAWGARCRFFSRLTSVDDGCYLEDGVVVEVAPGAAKQALFAPEAVPVPGAHNLENAMASALLARAMGVEAAQLAAGLAAFEGLPHRVQRVRERLGVLWYDDSKGTNVGATEKSLEGFADGTVHLILGGRNKGADPEALADVVRRKVRRLYLIGEAAAEFERRLGAVVATEMAGSMDRAVAAAAGSARPGEVVLLSPACASFDQYDNYARRGEHFQSLVQALTEAVDG